MCEEKIKTICSKVKLRVIKRGIHNKRKTFRENFKFRRVYLKWLIATRKYREGGLVYCKLCIGKYRSIKATKENLN